jgi:hypothetical protein
MGSVVNLYAEHLAHFKGDERYEEEDDDDNDDACGSTTHDY